MLLGTQLISTNNIVDHLLVTLDLVADGLCDGSHHVADQLAFACIVIRMVALTRVMTCLCCIDCCAAMPSVTQGLRVQDACGGLNTDGSTLLANGHKSHLWGSMHAWEQKVKTGPFGMHESGSTCGEARQRLGALCSRTLQQGVVQAQQVQSCHANL